MWAIKVISSLGYGGIVLLMAIESACIPPPSEILMPFSGFLVSQGQPVVRIFIAVPADVARMAIGRFIAYTFSCSLIWCWLLAYAGKRLGGNWTSLKPVFHEVHQIFAAAAAVFL